MASVFLEHSEGTADDKSSASQHLLPPESSNPLRVIFLFSWQSLFIWSFFPLVPNHLLFCWVFFVVLCYLDTGFTQRQVSSPGVTANWLEPPTSPCLFTLLHNLLFLRTVACYYYKIKLNWSQTMDCWTITAKISLAGASPEGQYHHVDTKPAALD